MHTPTMQSGYAYEFNPTPDDAPTHWRQSSSDLWDTILVTATGAETFVGRRFIDDCPCNIFLAPCGTYRAQGRALSD